MDEDKRKVHANLGNHGKLKYLFPEMMPILTEQKLFLPVALFLFYTAHFYISVKEFQL